MMQIFLIAGKAHCGKNTVAHVIKEYYESKKEKTVITEYSKYLKLFAREMLSWDGNEPKPRTFLQELGSFIREDMHKEYLFINRMKTDLAIYEHFFANVIICDVRLPDEIDEIKKDYPNTLAILVENDLQTANLTVKEAAHETEHALDNYRFFDYVLHNTDIEKLKKDIYTILKNIERSE